MATSFDKNDRRAVVDDIRRKKARAEKLRGLTIVGVSAVIAFLIIAVAAYAPVMRWWELRQFEGIDLSNIGAPASACGKVTTKDQSGNQDHVPRGTPVTYPDAPPAFGQHWDVWDEMDRKLYTEADRPAVAELVHNLEHGYTILWYDETVAGDEQQMEDLRGIASKYAGTDNLRLKFKAVPWTSADGKAFPDGQHVAVTHWTANTEENDGKQQGVWQYCSAPSGAALKQFMLDYPYTNSPEPTVR